MKKVNITKINRKKINRKKRGTRRRRSCHKGGTILGCGKDGCIIDSLSCGEFSPPKYVAKILINESSINRDVNNELERIDPENKRFNRHYFPSGDACNEQIRQNSDISELQQKGFRINGKIGFQKKLSEIPDPKKMTKDQWRHLRESMEILQANKIFHGDLPGNVMIDPDDKLPRIIDWENSKITDEPSLFIMDWNAFLTQFKTVKPE